MKGTKRSPPDLKIGNLILTPRKGTVSDSDAAYWQKRVSKNKEKRKEEEKQIERRNKIGKKE